MLAYSKKCFSLELFWFFLALAVLFALVLHIVVFDHHHPDELFGSEDQAAHHGEERRWWVALLAMAFIAEYALAFRSFLEIIAYERSRFRALCRVSAVEVDCAKIFNPIRRALSGGILHSRLFAEELCGMSFAG